MMEHEVQMVLPTPFCKWLMPILNIISMYNKSLIRGHFAILPDAILNYDKALVDAI